MGTTLERRRTGWAVVVGALLVLGGLVILGNAVLATALSVLFVGWETLIAGMVMLVGAVLRLRSGGFWSAALGGAVLVVLGLFILLHPLAGALSLTLLAGAMFLATGLVRIFASSQFTEARTTLIVSGIVSLALGLLVLFNPVAATITLLGLLLGVQTVVEGATLLVMGRARASTR